MSWEEKQKFVSPQSWRACVSLCDLCAFLNSNCVCIGLLLVRFYHNKIYSWFFIVVLRIVLCRLLVNLKIGKLTISQRRCLLCFSMRRKRSHGEREKFFWSSSRSENFSCSPFHRQSFSSFCRVRQLNFIILWMENTMAKSGENFSPSKSS